MKNKLKVFMLLTLIMTLFVSVVPVEAASAKSKAMKAYSTFLAKPENKGVKFAIAYIDNDNIPELVIDTYKEGVHTFKNGKVITVKNLITNNGWSDDGYYKKKGIVRTTGKPELVWCPTVFDMHARKLITVKCDYRKYKNGKADTMSFLSHQLIENEPVWKIKVKKEMPVAPGVVEMCPTIVETTKSKFDKALKKAVGNTKFTKFKFYKNTKANRAKYLK